MPTFFGISAFISMINTASENLKAILKQNNSIFFQHFSFYERLKFHAQFCCMKKFYNLKASG